MTSKRVFAGVVAAGLLLPITSFAQTADTQAQAKSLMEQIQALQLQLKTLLGSSTPHMNKPDGMMPPGQMMKAYCIELKRDLKVGSQGDDVRKLQEMLADDPETGFRGKPTGFFGPLTATAMAKYQMRMGIASSTDGRVGPMTRGFFERRCGKGLGMDDMMRGAAVRGEITAASASSITVKQKEGETRVVNIAASTTIKVLTGTGAPSTGTMADLTVGKMVMAEGEKNADGSLTARMITVGMLPPPGQERPERPERPMMPPGRGMMDR
jgi:peptidoglycan hydrolase-like protein with peptidoglycan-binding domain